MMQSKSDMYLIDTNVISEARKRGRANRGVREFFAKTIKAKEQVYISVVTIGELRRGVELIRHRGDIKQAEELEKWLSALVVDYGDYILGIDGETAQIWGRLRVPHPENALDKLIAATALIYDLIVVTRNDKHFRDTGVRLINPFTE
jgi:predicted nucleic acid-binding protein